MAWLRVVEQSLADDNVFAKIVRGEIPCDKVYEDESVLAFRDINPVAPSHVLVIPKRSVVSLREVGEADQAELGHLLWVAAEVARREGVAESGFRVVVNNGAEAGQEVPHLHLHVIGGRGLRGLG